MFLYSQTILVTLLFVLTVFSQNTKNSFEEKDVQYANGQVNLAATLLLPEGAGTFPAVVIVHGSGNSDRSNPWTTAYANALVKRGIAVLYPDKRGSGKSQGDWKTSSFTDLADDAIAGVEFLSKESRIDKARIGVAGFSQGGHVIPIAASLSSKISFVIDISGSTVPILEQSTNEVVMEAERAGLTKKQIAILKDINEKGLSYAIHGKGWKNYLSALNAAKSGELKGQKIIEDFPTDPNHWFAAYYRSIGDFDPIPYWQKLSIPILFVYGGQDTQIRIPKSLKRIEDTFSSNKRNYSVILFNGNGHALYREDLLAFIAQWITDKGIN